MQKASTKVRDWELTLQEVAAGPGGVRARSMNWTGDKGFGLNSRKEILPD